MATLTNDEIIKEIDLAINELVYEKTSLIKAYNYIIMSISNNFLGKYFHIVNLLSHKKR